MAEASVCAVSAALEFASLASGGGKGGNGGRANDGDSVAGVDDGRGVEYGTGSGTATFLRPPNVMLMPIRIVSTWLVSRDG